MTERCEHCKYFRPYVEGGQGLCRRYPPRIEALSKDQWQQSAQDGMPAVPAFHQHRPIVTVNDWCGEWAVRP